MTNVVDHLTNLYKHDLAACEVYETILKHITDESIKNKIQGFLEDHKRHAQDLSDVIQDQKGERPSDWRDLKGVLLELYTQVRSMTGQTGALKALQTAEKIVLDQYREAFFEFTDSQMIDLVKKNLHDEEKHGEYLRSLDM